jgi:hypothetical protein
MKKNSKFIWLAAAAALTFTTYITEHSERFASLTSLQLINEAHAVLGVRRRSMRRGVVIGSSMAVAGAAASSSATAAPAAAPEPAPAAAPVGALPIGSIVTTIPAACVSSPKNNVQYFDCSGVFYRTAFQGNNLVYVVSQP